MLEHIRSDRQPSPLSPLLAVRPAFGMDFDPLTCDHSPAEIIDTVFRVLCGYESVSEACLRQRIKPSQFYRWDENFVEICKKWSAKRFQLDQPRAGDSPAPASFILAEDDEVFAPSGTYLPEEITRWAEDRLAVAWRADYQSLRLAEK